MSADKVDAVPIPESEETQMKQNAIIENGRPVVNESSNYSGGRVKQISKSRVDQDQYTVNSGIAVIINNIEFDPSLELPDRKGSDVDASSLFQRFQELGFDSDLLNDASDEDITEKFNEIKEDKKALEDTGCLVVVLLTHGNEDHVFATDRSVTIKKLMDNFSAENCPELILKPKVFIFQACRGGELSRGVNARVTIDKNQTDAAGEFTDYDKIYGETIRIPNEADFLAVYATSSGYGAFRNTEKGSPFVRHLSEELHNMRKGENFYNVLTRVNRKVGTGYKPNYPLHNDICQMPCFISHLTKNLVLKPT